MERYYMDDATDNLMLPTLFSLQTSLANISQAKMLVTPVGYHSIFI
jgi:hypothetical protein